ncbi:hypothetical protein [Sphingomonas immobilis]|uniref:hypothetical protein n=1 Tax=Sphingomonas immobilis TaxID=3063997 RepID=UPI00272A3F53|nr:hypothetical protein [Sphingomonas sp. CA1-15]
MVLIQDRLSRWLKHRREERLLSRFGGIQTCPWCRQCAQSGGDSWGFQRWDRDPFLDVLTCSVCTGTSLWRFEIGMFYIGPLDPPAPQWPAVEYYDVEAARLRTPTKEPAHDQD